MEFVEYGLAGYVATIKINRPKALNALNTAVLAELEQAVKMVDAKTVRCVIITGGGEKAFVAGADIGEMAGLDVEGAKAFSDNGNRVFRMIEELPVPVIAAVNGYALGGGLELALACDIRVCSENALFGQPETGLGITPGFGGTQRLWRAVGLSRAKELIFTCRKVKAPEALELGLVLKVCPSESLMDEANAMAEAIARNVPMAVRESKRAIMGGADMDVTAGAALEAECFSACFTTLDRHNAMTAFLEKRKPEPFENK